MATTASLPPYLLPGVSVHQPPHLEGDASLATEILPGPPSLVSAQQASLKRDPKKPSIAYSYLPTSDPGSTYSGLMHGTLIGQDLEGPRSKRSRIEKGGTTGRAQRASARNQLAHPSTVERSNHLEAGSSSMIPLVSVDSDSATGGAEEEPSVSRSNSSLDLLSGATSTVASTKSRRKDKGKAKDNGTPPLKVKEEPKTTTLNSPEPPSNLLNNEDHCSSCRSYGALVYCDGCPRAFHLWCLDPPMEGVDDGDTRWFCPMCVARKNPPRKPPPSLLSPLIHYIQTSHPVEFQLPDDIRSYFRDVATGPKGSYVDGSEIKPPRLNRHGQLEDRDPHRLRDRNGDPILCFQCGKSALPDGLSTSIPAAKRTRRSTSTRPSPDTWKSILSCDYCPLHWHLDCLDPPLSTLPPFNKKWMCPNHGERVMASFALTLINIASHFLQPSKKRIPKHSAPAIEITKPHQFNNGNIEVIHPEQAASLPHSPLIADEVLINGRRYRVPEKIIVLDFWNKLNKRDEFQRDIDIPSAASSPLTSLSSLDDHEDHHTSESPAPSADLDDFSVAKMLCSLGVERSSKQHSNRELSSRGVQTDLENPSSSAAFSAAKNKVGRPRKNPLLGPSINGSSRNATSKHPDQLPSTPASVTVSTVRRRRPSQHQPEVSTRELRSRSRNNTSESSVVPTRSTVRHSENKDTPASLSISTKGKGVNIKVEEVDQPLFTSTPLAIETSTSSSNLSIKGTRLIRAPQQTAQNDPESTRKNVRKGRKRKTRDDELPAVEGEQVLETSSPISSKRGKSDQQNSEKTSQEVRRLISTPSRQNVQNESPLATSANVTPTTSLKIRLPRLSSLNVSGLPVTPRLLETPNKR
ncbi:hypothetical protein CVT24_005744 [Panaeolus cyanescens]|uniref:PHD-type domain-containing protein n=1 Tax=Panaeolus cyanescens TaxID=181874 RepID=A0A409VBA8_9AGAR|nr:hypothetical protein CVT24_005744 [Panaeolus cyanescens]